MIFPKLPTTMFLKFAIVGLLMAVAYGAGNLHATDRLLREREELGAITQAKNHEALILWYRDQMKEIRLAREQQEGADAAARLILERGKADADLAAQQARASLRIALGEKQKLEMTNAGLLNVNGMLADAARAPDPLCVLDGRVRSILNYASGAADSPGPGIAEAEAASIPVAATGEGSTASDGLTCDQLARGYVSLSIWGRKGWSLYDSWREWSDKALR